MHGKCGHITHTARQYECYYDEHNTYINGHEIKINNVYSSSVRFGKNMKADS